MFVNSFDLKTLGLHLLKRPNAWSAPKAERSYKALPSATKMVYTGIKSSGMRTVNVTAVLEASSHTALITALDELKSRIAAGLLTVYFSDDSTRSIQGYGSVDVPEEYDAAWVQLFLPVTIVLECLDPRWIATSLTTVTGSDSPLPIGTARTPPVIQITGNTGSPLTNPHVDYRNYAGTVLWHFTWTGTLSGAQTLVVDCGAFTVKIGSTNEIEHFSGDFFDLDPADGDYFLSHWPDTLLTKTSGTCDAYSVEYYKRWL